MKFQEINRIVALDEVRSTYTVGNLVVNLTSRFSDKVTLEDEIYQIILQRLRSKKKSNETQSEGRHFDENML